MIAVRRPFQEPGTGPGKRSGGRGEHRARHRAMGQTVPCAEQVTPARRQHAPRFPVGGNTVREKHHAELAEYRIESAIREGQRLGIRHLEPHAVHPRLCRRQVEHRRVQVGRRDDDAVGALGCQQCGKDTRAGRGFEHGVDWLSEQPSRHFRRERLEEQRPHVPIVDRRHRADKDRVLVRHALSLPSQGLHRSDPAIYAGDADRRNRQRR